MNSDFNPLLRLFRHHKVRYLVVGAYAVMKYSEPRFTKDLDLWIDTALANAARVHQALGGLAQGLPRPAVFGSASF